MDNLNVLFLCKGDSINGISTLIKNQGKSLENIGIIIQYFPITGKGFGGYLRAVFSLNKYLENQKYDIVHAHFSLTAFTATLALASPLVVSLMGWNVKLWYYKWLILLFNRISWKAVIVKSESMKEDLGISKNIYVIPNGVDLERFKPINKEEALKITGWKAEKNILFAANPHRPIKRYPLALSAFQSLNRVDTELHILNNIPNDLMPYYYNACDLVLLTSRAEGSPNVIKEAMACNCPIVTTRVGDVEKVVGDTKGCFITGDNEADIAENITKALKFNAKTHGREKIMHLNEKIIAQKILAVYRTVLKK